MAIGLNMSTGCVMCFRCVHPDVTIVSTGSITPTISSMPFSRKQPVFVHACGAVIVSKYGMQSHSYFVLGEVVVCQEDGRCYVTEACMEPVAGAAKRLRRSPVTVAKASQSSTLPAMFLFARQLGKLPPA